MPKLEPDRFERIENRLDKLEKQLSLLPDWKIKQLASEGMLDPFQPSLVRAVNGFPVISYGLSSYGYDLRLSPNDFRIFRHIPGEVINPKRFNPAFLEQAQLQSDVDGDYFIIPGNSYALGVTVEKIALPENVTCLFLGKSTYARLGLIANLTPGEAGWQGHLTLEFSNSSSADTRIYANEGVVQALFFESLPCEVSYTKRKGKYQNQLHQVTLARV